MVKILLCDDDTNFLPHLQKKIHAILKEDKQEAMVFTYSSPDTVPDTMVQEADVFFLDMDFRNKTSSGIDLARKIRKWNQDAILIFVTNYIEYAPEGYEVQAFRYLMKSELDTKLPPCLRQAMGRLRSEQKTVRLFVSGEPVTFCAPDILYMESQGHAAVIHMIDKSSHKLYAAMADLEQKFAPLGFLRVHKSYLVNMERITKFQYNALTLDDGTELPVSQKSYAQQKQVYLQWKGRD